MSDLIYCTPAQLRIHPDNMRRVYKPSAVDEMATSIKAAGGVLQALLVVPDERPDTYLVVDGNMRLAGARLLGDECPLLKCEPIDANYASQLLVMATTSAFHYAKDPISEALHYKRLLAEGYSQSDISRHTGIAVTQIVSRLRLLDLEREIQDLVAAGNLPRDRRVAEALLSIPERPARVKMAHRLANNHAGIDTVQRACAKLVESLATAAALQHSNAPAIALSHSKNPPPAQHHALPVSGPGSLRAASQAACAACEIHANSLSKVPEPAWSLISHAAGDTCATCSLRELQTLCGECPAVELLRRITAELRDPAAAPARVAIPLPENRHANTANRR